MNLTSVRLFGDGMRFVVILTAFLFYGARHPKQTVYAQGLLAAADVIETVNALRSSQGLAPYAIDSGLMAYAQEHAEYMARIGRGTHQHSDGSLPLDHGLQENVAGGTISGMTTSFVVYTIWADPVHMRTMTGYSTGSMGVGVATNDRDIYISLDVRPSGASTSPGVNSSRAAGSETPQALIASVVTSTPGSDGSVTHVVAYGQSLWQIAITYGVKMDDIRALNGLPADSTTIYEGQTLLIRPPGSILPSMTASPTAVQPAVSEVKKLTRTPTPTQRVIPTTSPTKELAEPSPTPEPDAENSAFSVLLEWLGGYSRSLLIGLVFFAAAVFLGLFLMSFRK